ncbi:Gypsy retrotransposon integrase-like protein 1 [Elasticomyces elasticus]|uniref:Gypsy retrotransposon integrase-like protein 1 n=1 Tax=Exophiala sideris TaxID=1016849 RepID=A0ABR0IUN1_9EURO|nr:Gypsy retrotransposon integrase-like protein 1 [Elasticomyces elasticus]KAK5021073.1 Gypsy retrotransposon integrase-like protein 1 [Exophiala sideris]KAK5023356.1 Gypsy retrotransposon integrase-like protein 1 [Exophiala sideris]KAK5048778.1 Gypsy retrotransposon integrase-like protein 1 [Exophiala sideris]KAK5176205.1 Gypsy retrotransposon integrase-like protein 1 [Eurotiomycetes sp. CCFEE 6388]
MASHHGTSPVRLMKSPECTYVQPRCARTSTADYVRELESKNRRLSELVSQSTQADKVGLDSTDWRRSSLISSSSGGATDIHDATTAEDHLETMIDGVGQLQQDKNGSYSYHGHYAGLTLLKRVHECCRRLMPSISPDTAPDITQIFDQSVPSCKQPPTVQLTLPEKAVAKCLTSVALNDASCLMTFIDVPSFDRMLERIYTIEEELYSETEFRFLALFYASLAVGALFTSTQNDMEEEGTSQSYTYFLMAHSMIDPAQCRDLTTMQAILFIIIYLQALGRLSDCYSYLALAWGSAAQMGLHRSYTPAYFDSLQTETRKRIYWTLCTMDIYLSNLLGLPRTVGQSFGDQEMPKEVVAGQLAPLPPSPRLRLANHHTRLLNIMSKVVDFLCPTSVTPSEHNRYRRVEASKLSQIEVELAEWYSALPAMAEQSGAGGHDQICAHLRLRLAYAHVQMVLYRPFLHHIMGGKARSEAEMRSYACASSCIKAAMQVIWIVQQLHQQGRAVAPYWLAPFMTLFSAMTLVMFALSNKGGATVDEAWEAVNSAYSLFSDLSSRSLTARRCAAVLEAFTMKRSASSVHSPTSILYSDTGSKTSSVSPMGKLNVQDSQSREFWPILSDGTAQLSNITTTSLGAPSDLLDVHEAEGSSGMAEFELGGAIDDDSIWLTDGVIESTNPPSCIWDDIPTSENCFFPICVRCQCNKALRLGMATKSCTF